MKHKFSLFLYFQILLFSTIFAQTVNGTIVDVDNEPLPGVNIYIVKKYTGTITNGQGEFSLNINDLSNDDHVKFSHIGYSSITKSVDELLAKNNWKITLKDTAILLAEITVLPTEYLENPKKIVKKAIANIPTNHSTNPYAMNGFYRHVNREDDQYKRLLEAAITIYDEGYQTNSYKFNVDEIRKSFDLRRPQNKAFMNTLFGSKDIKASLDIWNDTTSATASELAKWEDWYEELNLPYFYRTNYARQHNAKLDDVAYGILGDDFVNEHKFKLDTITIFENEMVYVVKILPSSKSKKYMLYNSRSLVFPVGKLYINTANFSILRMEYSYILNPRKSKTLDYQVLFASNGSGIMFKTITSYREINGKMYLSYIYRYEPDKVAYSFHKKRKSNYTKGYFFMERELLINNVILDEASVRNIEQNSAWSSKLYSNDSPYNEAFWENYTVLKETPIQQKLIEDLEKETSLKEQFSNHEN